MSDTVTITGNTYPVKDQIKQLGGRWNRDAKGWDVPTAHADTVRALIAAAPVSYPPRRHASNARYGSSYTQFSSGAEQYTNRRGRCEDAPCCGCCS